MNRELKYSKMSEKDFLQSISKYWKKLFHLALTLRGNYDDAQDAVQDVIIHATKKRSQFLGKSSIYTWLVRILINYCKDKYNKDKRMWNRLFTFHNKTNSEKDLEIADNRENPERKIELRETSNRLINVLQKLSPSLRELVILRYYEDLTYIEISGILKIPEGTVKSRLSNARKILKKLLENAGISEVSNGL